LNAILDDPTLKDSPVTLAMSDSLPFVLPSTRIDALAKMITKENPGVLVKTADGRLDIITEFDLIGALTD